ncbi:MAG TPA: hypothetical protein VM261_14135 [Kofleriaceae bacterium]|nr:hypothetical protein [Kofleriaceae bacterium]
MPDAFGSGDLMGTSEISLQRFAHASVEETTVNTRLRERLLVGDDGSLQRLGYFDTELGVDCSLQDRYGDGTPNCAPRVCSNSDFFSRTSCGRELMRSDNQDRDCICGPSLFGERLDASLRPVAIVRMEPIPEDTLVCPDGESVDEGFYEAIDVELATATPQVDGSGRIRAIEYAVGDGATATGFFDAELDATCVPARASDGTIRCIPHAQAAIFDQFFLDDMCTLGVRVVAAWGPRGRTVVAAREFPWNLDSAVSPDSVVSFDTRALPDAPRLYEVGDLPPSLYSGSSWDCRPYVFDPDLEPWRLVGPQMPPARFGVLNAVIERSP